VVLKRLTGTIVQQVEAMKSMVKAFADYASTPQTDFMAVDLNELINQTCWLYREGGEKDVDGESISLTLDASLPTMQCDPNRIRQLLHNIIKNAFEASDGSTGCRINISSRLVTGRTSESIELVFEDNGPGFATEVRERLFEPYVTTKIKGTGLGLAIVKKIVEEHGGTVRAEILEDEGYAVVVAEDAKTARETLAERVPDLVLLDIWMPDQDGVSLLKEWRDQGALKFPVVMISGHGTVETAVEATRLGAVDFIEKKVCGEQ